MRISDLEGRPDWKQIVESVECPLVVEGVPCGAPVGHPCRNIGAAYGTLAATKPRNDWHQARKELAASKWRQTKEDEQIRLERKEVELLEEIVQELQHPTPITIVFKEITMNPTLGGNTLIFTGVLQPTGSAYPAGTTFTVTSNDPAILPTVDATGLIVTIPLPQGWVENPNEALTVSYQSSVFVAVPSTSPDQILAVITPSAPPPPPTSTPTSITFGQTQ